MCVALGHQVGCSSPGKQTHLPKPSFHNEGAFRTSWADKTWKFTTGKGNPTGCMSGRRQAIPDGRLATRKGGESKEQWGMHALNLNECEWAGESISWCSLSYTEWKHTMRENKVGGVNVFRVFQRPGITEWEMKVLVNLKYKYCKFQNTVCDFPSRGKQVRKLVTKA